MRVLETCSLAECREALVAKFAACATAERKAGPEQRTVLVVDDDREVSQCLGVRLQAAGFTVLSAYDGEEGLAAAYANQPDAVVLDVRMPKKDGLTVLRELRTTPSMRRTPIVMLSASIRDQHTALEAGASYFVPKPYEAKDILSAIESSMREEGHL
jgi:two-component system response regulator VicR